MGRSAGVGRSLGEREGGGRVEERGSGEEWKSGEERRSGEEASGELSAPWERWEAREPSGAHRPRGWPSTTSNNDLTNGITQKIQKGLGK